MISPILTGLFNLRHHRQAPRRLFVVVDRASSLAVAEVVRCLKPWRSWITLTGIIEGDPSTVARTAAQGVDSCDIVLVLSDDQRLTDAARAAWADSHATIVDATLPAEGTRELALFQEVLHHDIELGGYNDWSNGDSQFGSAVLQTLSVAHCWRRYPDYATRLLPQGRGAPIRALDVGCGALSRLRWGALAGAMVVTGVDPLLDMFSIVRERHGLDGLPSIRCATEICAEAETLRDVLPAASMDFVYCANALDHAADPVEVMNGIAHVLRPGGLLAVEVFTREGSRENWWQLHQFDMYADEADRFLCESKDGVARDMVPSDGALRIREYLSRNAMSTAFVAERVEN